MPRRDEYDDFEDDRDRGRSDDRDEQEGDYDDRPARGREAALQRVSLPAIFLMIIGGLGLLMAVFALVIVVTGMQGPNPFMNPQQANDPAFQAGQKIGKVLAPIIRFVWAAIVLFGGLQMKNLKSRGFVIFSCIWAMLPCNECCLIGLPFGIWALVVVNDEKVKRWF